VSWFRLPDNAALTALLAPALPPGTTAKVRMPWIWIQSSPGTTKPAQARAMATAQAALERLPSVEAAFTRASLDGIEGRLAGAVRAAWDAERSGDLYVVPAPGAVFDEEHLEHGGTSHGSPWAYDRLVPILTYGAGVRRSAEPVPMGSIAPTLSALLGIRAPRQAREASLLSRGGR
jgi:hypothetical protein